MKLPEIIFDLPMFEIFFTNEGSEGTVFYPELYGGGVLPRVNNLTDLMDLVRRISEFSLFNTKVITQIEASITEDLICKLVDLTREPYSLSFYNQSLGSYQLQTVTVPLDDCRSFLEKYNLQMKVNSASLNFNGKTFCSLHSNNTLKPSVFSFYVNYCRPRFTCASASGSSLVSDDLHTLVLSYIEDLNKLASKHFNRNQMLQEIFNNDVP